MATPASAVLDSLVPKVNQAIIDLVEAAGVDVGPWAIKADGTPAANPRANPSYCYEWAFGGREEPTVVCIWHSHLTIEGDLIVFEDNLSQYAIALEEVRFDKRKPQSVRSRAIDQAARARAFDLRVQRAFAKQRPIRVILLKGDQKEVAELGYRSSKVEARLLDTEPWHVQSYDHTSGLMRIVRGTRPTISPPAPAALPKLVDQFSAPPPQTTTTTTTNYSRSPEVRAKALNRAAGECELCGAPGFKTEDGSLFLETHHVIALCDKGPDVEWNVVAICPNDHREAHLGRRREEIKRQLMDVLAKHYPSAPAALAAISSGAEESVPA